MTAVCRLLLILLTTVAAARTGEPEADYKDLFPPLTPVPDAENGWLLMEELSGLCEEREVRNYQFYRFTEPEQNLVLDRESLDEFLELHGDVVPMIRQILARPGFQIPPGQEAKSFTILSRGYKAIAAQAVIAAENDQWEKAWPDFLLLHGFSQKMFDSGAPSSVAMMGIGCAWSGLDTATWAIQSCQDAKALRAAAREFKLLENQKSLFTGSDRSEFLVFRAHFKVLKEGEEPLKKVLVTLHPIRQAIEDITDAVKPGADVAEGKAGIERSTDRLVPREEWIAEMLKDPPKEVQEQMKAAALVDWDAATARFFDWNRALVKADCSTWEQFQKSRPHPKAFLDGFSLKQVEALHDVNEFTARNVFKVIAKSRMLQLNLALKAWHLEHRDLPERLDQLVPDCLPALPLDPFNGKAIGYDNEASLLWCVGPDLKKHDGNAKSNDDTVVHLRLH